MYKNKNPKSMSSLALLVVLTIGLLPCIEAASLPTFQQEKQFQPECIYKHPNAPTTLPSILIPLYHSTPKFNQATGVCTDEIFMNVAKGCNSVLVVINPNSGPAIPGSFHHNGHRACAKMLSGNNVTIVGYVKTKEAYMDPATGGWTTTGIRNLEDTKRDIDIWVDNFKDIPGYKGIFVDETSTHHQTVTEQWDVDHTAVYREIINYIKYKFPNGLVVLNPGSFPHTSLLDPAPGFPQPADISCPYEDTAAKWSPKDGDCSSLQWTNDMGSFGPGPWCKNVPQWDELESFKNGVSNGDYNAAALLHSIAGDIEFAKSEARTAFEHGFKYYFPTDRTLLNNPWKTIPSFWFKYLEFLNNYGYGDQIIHPTTTTTTTTTTTAPTPVFTCPPNWQQDHNKNYADVYNCHKFYHCTVEEVMHWRCVEGGRFDPTKRYCASADKTPCIEIEVVPVTTTTTTTTTIAITTTTTTTTTIPKPIPTSAFTCPPNWQQDSNKNYPDVYDCNMFYHCTVDEVKHWKCVDGGRFNPISRYCGKANEIPCNNGVAFTCPVNWQQDSNPNYADIMSQTMFYHCTVEGALHWKCAKGGIFNPITRFCVYQ